MLMQTTHQGCCRVYRAMASRQRCWQQWDGGHQQIQPYFWPKRPLAQIQVHGAPTAAVQAFPEFRYPEPYTLYPKTLTRLACAPDHSFKSRLP